MGDHSLTDREIRKLAFQTGFCKRAGGKIKAPDFLINMCLESVKGTVSYNDLAACMETETGIAASRQAYWEKTDESCVRFFQAVLERVMHSKCAHEDVQKLCVSGKFSRILVQDSTVIRLPLRLFDVFSGVKNAHIAVCNARIQGTYDLVSGCFVKFSIDSYSKNDQSVALDIEAKPGDLILRDRGYFKIEAIAQQQKSGAQSINRYKHKTSFFDPVTGNEVNLLDLLTQQGSVDMELLAGVQNKFNVRLIAVPVSEELANLRRMKAKKETHGHAPSKQVLKLMSWTIFITTISDPKVSFKEILGLYELRWRIENIFKTWKSNFSFDKVHNVSEHQLHVLLNARLIMITIFYQKIYLPLLQRVKDTTGKELSLMKLMRYLTQNIRIARQLLEQKKCNRVQLQAIARYCTYDKRNRANFPDKMALIIQKVSQTSSLA